MLEFVAATSLAKKLPKDHLAKSIKHRLSFLLWKWL